MKKPSKRAITAITNFILVLVIAVVGTVCFLPNSASASSIEEEVYYRGKSEDGVSLMFNVYQGAQEVKGILDVLDEYDAKATFFLGGCWADDNVAVVQEIVARGQEIGSHGYFHRDHDKLNYEENKLEISRSVEFLTLATGITVTLFAPPSGAYSNATVRAAQSLDLKTVMWSKDTIDWRDKDETVCFSRATKEIKGGDLVLMHPTPHTLAALPNVLKYYREQNLHAITVSENLAQP